MLIAFVPVLHQGYFTFFALHGGDGIGILGNDIIADVTALTRDLRTVDAEMMRRAVQSLDVAPSVRVVSRADLEALRGSAVTMPDDDVSHELALQYDLRATFISVFLRWDKLPTTVTKIPATTSSVDVRELDRAFMAQAEREAAHSSDWWRHVGGVIAKDGVVVLTSHNRHLPTDFHLAYNGDPRSNFNAGEHIECSTAIHAEADLIARAAEGGVALRGASLYVTTFPCPNCARLVAISGIERVYYTSGYSLLDADEIFRAFGVETIHVNLTQTDA